MPELPTVNHLPASLPHLHLVTQDNPHTRPSRPASKLADWFSGESVPITFALIPSPTKEKADPVDGMASSDDHNPTHRPKLPATRPSPRPPIVSRFSLFGPKSTVPSKTQPTPSDLHDQWHDLDVKSALDPSPKADPLSPSAFKDLHKNAEGLLLKLQAAYKQRSQALHDILAEKDAQAEELEGAQMRTKHLKLQLDDMTAKLAEQDRAMMDLVDQLAEEKQARREAHEVSFATKSARQTTGSGPDQADRKEDNQRTERTWKSRTSTASDLSVESEGSCAESLFSRHGASSPAMSMSSVSTANSPETQQYQPPAQASQRYPQVPETSAPFSASRLLGISAKAPRRDYQVSKATARCANCSRYGDSEVWSLVDTLKLENRGLKTRLGQLENTVDDCLDLVKGLF
ncbi:MAG: hypothetical protein L6R39_001796 [Caloplaca ligustica]|nr:MAG: hypothetical protein L6R39_001796 [Caloplaca ligustica]